MIGTQVHIAAMFDSAEKAHAARDAIIAAGVDATRILVLDRDAPESGTHSHVGLWGTLKRWLLPDIDAHHYAEGVSRGMPLLIADVDIAQHSAAVAALERVHPIDIEQHAADWRADGWAGEHPSQTAWTESDEDEDEFGEVAVPTSGLITGDYGAVGAPLGGAAVDTNIVRVRGRVRSYMVR